MTKNNFEYAYQDDDKIVVYGAREHNLKNIDITIPRNKLVVITGLSGSGKSSLAFDTIFAEGQRRYIESFSAYIRQFLGGLKRPDVDKITGLSPVIAIEQKTTNKSPRSTVGTTTEIYDFLRLLYARVADAYSYKTGEKMISYTSNEITDLILEKFSSHKITILAPLIKGRKGHYRELFENLGKKGFSKVRIDGDITNIEKGLQTDRYKIHDIEVIIDRIEVKKEDLSRIKEAIKNALKMGDKSLIINDFDENKDYFFSQSLTCPTTGISYKEPEPNLFSFNSPYGACKKCRGLGFLYQFDENKIIPNKNTSIKKGAIYPLGKYKKNYIFGKIEELAEKHKVDISKPFKSYSEIFIEALMNGEEEDNSFNGILNYLNDVNEFNEGENKWLRNYMSTIECPTCQGTRLQNESLNFRINNKNIAEISSFDLSELNLWLQNIEEKISPDKRLIAHEILKETREKLSFLLDVGLEYLTLNRTSKSLSGGESQRIRLASQIGSKLINVLYILDEPSIGLHQRDNSKLIKALKQLRDNGNSVIVVEHDREIMEESDYIIDIGPKAGRFGGEIIDQGTFKQLNNKSSTTYRYLKGIDEIIVPNERRKGNGKFIELKEANGHNLKKVNLKLPLGVFNCITGISGSGKSSLINGTLTPILYNHINNSKVPPLPFKSIKGIEHIDKIIEIDQAPIGRTPRSNPATYTGVFSDIRTLYSELPESKIMGFKPGRFSFNVSGGRCEECKGAGLKNIEMNFLPDVFVECPNCNGKRYNNETLKIKYKGKSINDVLNMSINDALNFFDAHPRILRKIKALNDVGLGYVKLGQQSTTLSGGEAQRIKLASELSKKTTGKTIFILDEPTTGLHFEDINILIGVLNKIVDAGNTIVVIEHNLDVIKVADYIIDLGPEGGKNGGEIIATGTPEELIQYNKSITGEFLKKELERK